MLPLFWTNRDGNYSAMIEAAVQREA